MAKFITPFKTLGKYKYAILVLVLGLGLMLMPEKSEEKPQPQPQEIQSQTPAELEERLQIILSRIQGAGQVEVLLTESAGAETLYQTDTQDDTGDTSRHSSDTVLIQDSAREESGLVRRKDAAVYRGALVVCQGAEDPKVRLAIVEAVACVTGLGADHITVVKMK